MIAQVLWILGSSIFAVLGLAHLRITFYGKKLFPKSEVVEAGMKETHPRLTKATTMWKAWIGFNASHSAGAIFFGIVNILLAIQHFDVLLNSTPLLLLNAIFVGFFIFLGKVYWFKIPYTGIILASICFICSLLLVIFGN